MFVSNHISGIQKRAAIPIPTPPVILKDYKESPYSSLEEVQSVWLRGVTVRKSIKPCASDCDQSGDNLKHIVKVVLVIITHHMNEAGRNRTYPLKSFLIFAYQAVVNDHIEHLLQATRKIHTQICFKKKSSSSQRQQHFNQ